MDQLALLPSRVNCAAENPHFPALVFHNVVCPSRNIHNAKTLLKMTPRKLNVCT